MAYCTYDDVLTVTGQTFSMQMKGYVEFWLDVIDIAIDDTIEAYGKRPDEVSDTRKRKVAQLMGAAAYLAFQMDPNVVSYTLTSGDTSESETRLASSAAYSRITKMEPIYLQLLGLKNEQFGNIRTETRWR